MIRRKKNRFLVETLLGWTLLAIMTASCVDLELPDLTHQWGSGPTDGPYCPPDLIDSLEIETLKIHVIDVGQGDAIWIQTPWFVDQELESRNIIIDTGPIEHSAILLDYLFTRGLGPGSQIHALVITHAHADHYGGLSTLLENYDVLRYIDPGFAGGSTQFLEARNAATLEVVFHGGSPETPAIPGLVAALFQDIDVFGDSVAGQLLWGLDSPLNGNVNSASGSDINNTSVVLNLSYGGAKALLMGDAELAVEEQLVAEAAAGGVQLRANVLKVGHHGSASSSSAAFLAQVFPAPSAADWAIISSGRKSFGGTQLPAIATVTRLGNLLDPYHVLSTENRDEFKEQGDEAGDDHVIITLGSDSETRACYAP